MLVAVDCRGTGLVTRTPLEIALRQSDFKSAELSYNVVKGDASTRVARHNIDFSEIPKEIEVATNLIAGNGKDAFAALSRSSHCRVRDVGSPEHDALSGFA